MPGNVSNGFSHPRKPKRCRVSIFCCGEKYAPTGTHVNLFAIDSSAHETPPETNHKKYHITISKRKLQTLEKEASIGRKFMSKMNNKKYVASPNARTMLGIMMAHVPKVSLENVELIIAMSNASLFLDMGLQSSSAPLWSPSAATLKEIIVEEAINSVVLEQKNFEGKPSALMCDKGAKSK